MQTQALWCKSLTEKGVFGLMLGFLRFSSTAAYAATLYRSPRDTTHEPTREPIREQTREPTRETIRDITRYMLDRS